MARRSSSVESRWSDKWPWSWRKYLQNPSSRRPLNFHRSAKAKFLWPIRGEKRNWRSDSSRLWPCLRNICMLRRKSMIMRSSCTRWSHTRSQQWTKRVKGLKKAWCSKGIKRWRQNCTKKRCNWRMMKGGERGRWRKCVIGRLISRCCFNRSISRGSDGSWRRGNASTWTPQLRNQPPR
jgi:hypothetical protein